VPEGERDCPQCGEPRCTFDHARSLVIEYTPPKIDVIEYRREKVVCPRCEGEISVAPAPAERVIDGALPGPQLLAALTINKTVDGLPLRGACGCTVASHLRVHDTIYGRPPLGILRLIFEPPRHC